MKSSACVDDGNSLMEPLTRRWMLYFPAIDIRLASLVNSVGSMMNVLGFATAGPLYTPDGVAFTVEFALALIPAPLSLFVGAVCSGLK